jgi:hypothetical protein
VKHLSTHVCNDDARHWTFARSSGLPRDYFQPAFRITPDMCVFVVCVVVGIALFFIH